MTVVVARNRLVLKYTRMLVPRRVLEMSKSGCRINARKVGEILFRLPVRRSAPECTRGDRFMLSHRCSHMTVAGETRKFRDRRQW